MRWLTRLVQSLAASESGATAIEYTLIAALVGTAAIFGFDLVGQSLEEVFDTVDAAL